MNNMEVDNMCDKFFVPFSVLDGGRKALIEYQKLRMELLHNPNDIRSIGHIVSILQDYIYDANSYKYEDEYSAEELFMNKRNALLEVLLVSQGIRQNTYLHLEYLSIMAQSYYMLGDWNNALKYYEEMLLQPGVLDVEYSESYYAGELELAAKIVHNICLIYVCSEKYHEASDTKKKYSFIFDLEMQRTQRLIMNNPHLKEGFEKEWDQLTDFSENKYFYFDDLLHFGFISGDGMLLAVYKDALSNQEAYKVKLDAMRLINQVSRTEFMILDEEWFGDTRVIDISVIGDSSLNENSVYDLTEDVQWGTVNKIPPLNTFEINE